MSDPQYTLSYCTKCNQMTNHLDGECQKCKSAKNIEDEFDRLFSNVRRLRVNPLELRIRNSYPISTFTGTTQDELVECVMAERLKAEIEAFDIAFDSHDYDRLRRYRAELEAELSKLGGK
jgi:predicted ATP-dependent serine protease